MVASFAGQLVVESLAVFARHIRLLLHVSTITLRVVKAVFRVCPAVVVNRGVTLGTAVLWVQGGAIVPLIALIWNTPLAPAAALVGRAATAGFADSVWGGYLVCDGRFGGEAESQIGK